MRCVESWCRGVVSCLFQYMDVWRVKSWRSGTVCWMFQYLDEIIVEMDTCEIPRTPTSSTPVSSFRCVLRSLIYIFMTVGWFTYLWWSPVIRCHKIISQTSIGLKLYRKICQLSRHFKVQKLNPYCYLSSSCCCWGDDLQKSLKLRRFKLDRDKIWEHCSSRKFAYNNREEDQKKRRTCG